MLEEIPTFILCGGDGTRVKSLFNGMPKVLFPCLGGTVLENVVCRLTNLGLVDVYFLCSIKHQKVTGHIRDHLGVNPNQIIEEPQKLGTGGAISSALFKVDKSHGVFVVNGDTLFDSSDEFAIPLRTLDVTSFKNKVVMFTAEPAFRDASHPNGWSTVRDGNLIFAKDVPKYSISTGVYYIGSGVCDFLMDWNGDSFHLEADFLAKSEIQVETITIQGRFFDLGTPERYAFAKEIGIV